MKHASQVAFIFSLSAGLLMAGCSTALSVPPPDTSSGELPSSSAADSQVTAVELDIISPANAGSLAELAVWGQGSGHFPVFSPDGELAVVSWSGIHIYDPQTLDERTVLSASDVFDIAFSPDGQIVSAVSGFWADSYVLQQWDLSTGTELNNSSVDSTLRNYDDRIGVFSPDGDILALILDEETVKLWDAATGAEMQSLRTRAEELAFSPDGGTLVTGTPAESVVLWDVPSGSQLRTFDIGYSYSMRLLFSPDGRTLAIAGLYGAVLSPDYTVSLVDLASGQELVSIVAPVVPDMAGNPTFSLSFSPDGEMLATASAEVIKVWNVTGGSELISISTADVDGLAFSPDSMTLVSSSSVGDDSVRLWNVATGDLVGTLKGENVLGLGVFSADSRSVAYASYDGDIRLRDLATGDVRTLDRYGDTVLGLAFSPDGKILASGGYDNNIRLRDVSGGELLHALSGHTSPVEAVVFSPDGSMIGSTSYDSTVRLWDVVTGAEIHAFGAGNSLAFSPDGILVAVGSEDNTVGLWDVASGVLIRSLTGHADSIYELAFSPDGNQLYSSAGDGTRLWDVASGQELATLSTTYARSIFSPDGRMVATRAMDATLTVLDTATRETIYALSGESDRLPGPAFSPDGSLLVTGLDNATLWDSASGEELARLNTGPAIRMTFSPDGRLLLVWGGRGQTLWGIPQ
jgi:WD40 repeat protein